MACMARKKLLFLLVGMAIGIIIIYGIYFLFVGQGGRKEKGIYNKKKKS